MKTVYIIFESIKALGSLSIEMKTRQMRKMPSRRSLRTLEAAAVFAVINPTTENQ